MYGTFANSKFFCSASDGRFMLYDIFTELNRPLFHNTLQKKPPSIVVSINYMRVFVGVCNEKSGKVGCFTKKYRFGMSFPVLFRFVTSNGMTVFRQFNQFGDVFTASLVLFRAERVIGASQVGRSTAGFRNRILRIRRR